MCESKVSEAVHAIRGAIGDHTPRAAIILGSGLGGLTARLECPRAIPFVDIPHFARSTAKGHRGEIVAGYLGSGSTVPVVAMAGRLHCYEGWSIGQVTFPVAVLASLGAKVLIVSNAAGGLNPHYRVGDMMVLRDHINLIPRPVTGEHGDNSKGSKAGSAIATPYKGPRCPYDAELAAVTLKAARNGNFAAWEGTYLATLGPTYETRAEYRMMRRFGADAVGMSTVPEVLEAGRRGMRVLAISMISNVARPDEGATTTHQEVLEAGRQAEPRMHQMVQAAMHTLQ